MANRLLATVPGAALHLLPQRLLLPAVLVAAAALFRPSIAAAAVLLAGASTSLPSTAQAACQTLLRRAQAVVRLTLRVLRNSNRSSSRSRSNTSARLLLKEHLVRCLARHSRRQVLTLPLMWCAAQQEQHQLLWRRVCRRTL